MLTVLCCLKPFNGVSLASGERRSALTWHYKNNHVSTPVLTLPALAPASRQYQNLPFA